MNTHIIMIAILPEMEKNHTPLSKCVPPQNCWYSKARLSTFSAAPDSFYKLHRYTSRWQQVTVFMSESLTFRNFFRNETSDCGYERGLGCFSFLTCISSFPFLASQLHPKMILNQNDCDRCERGGEFIHVTYIVFQQERINLCILAHSSSGITPRSSQCIEN